MSDNVLSMHIDLDSPGGKKVLAAIAAAFADGDVGAIHSRPEAEARRGTIQAPKSAEPDPTPAPATAAQEEVEDSAPASPEPSAEAPAEKSAVKRRRTKAQIEEDQAEGLDDAFKKAAKEHPDWDVDTVRKFIRGGGDGEAVGESAADEDAPVTAPPVADEWAPSFEEPATTSAAEPEQAGPPADWEPDWA